LNEIGENFKEARLSSSISLDETSADTNIPIEALEQIEEGSIGSFKDIFKLKEYLQTYAKYLGLDANKVIDDFNEYMFEYTSKIPLDNLALKMFEQHWRYQSRIPLFKSKRGIQNCKIRFYGYFNNSAHRHCDDMGNKASCVGG